MKKRLLVLIITILFLIPFTSALTVDYTNVITLNKTGTIGEFPSLGISQLKYEPFPVEPGEKFDLWIKVKDVGSDPAEEVSVILVETKTFSIDGPNTVTVGEIQPNQEALIKFEDIRVADDVVEGINEIEFLLSPGGSYKENVLSRKLDIEIRSVEPVLNIYVETDPKVLSQGSPAKLNITLENLENSIIEEIKIKLTLPNEIVPIGTSIEKKLDRLLPNQRSSLIYEVIPLGDALSKAYNIPINLTYRDEIGNKFAIDEAIGLLVGSKIDFDVNIKETDIIKKGQKGKITIGISNIGPSDIKFLILEIKSSKEYEVLSNKKEYIGNLESDDFETSEFTIFVKKNDPKIKALITYKDNFNQEKSEVRELTLNTFSSNEVKKYNLVESKNSLINLIYLAILILIYLTWSEWRRTKDLQRSVKTAFIRFLKGIFRIIRSLSWRNIKRLPRRLKNLFDSL
ncbi:MAG: hypothetical protein QGF74_01350 [Candidatus Nanoarchaeia archaeon]|jgi:hypothetical protein|nr:hypothetical protein [Candidatus Nanoarchaeia archaeon]|tara:strand:- start:867 stop:2237 length:1371 start_codon:yes stop_codon:yes gene_type:complete